MKRNIPMTKIEHSLSYRFLNINLSLKGIENESPLKANLIRVRTYSTLILRLSALGCLIKN
jgi:hypothetical protein